MNMRIWHIYGISATITLVINLASALLFSLSAHALTFREIFNLFWLTNIVYYISFLLISYTAFKRWFVSTLVGVVLFYPIMKLFYEALFVEKSILTGFGALLVNLSILSSAITVCISLFVLILYFKNRFPRR
jgi:hypothetical protein